MHCIFDSIEFRSSGVDQSCVVDICAADEGGKRLLVGNILFLFRVGLQSNTEREK